MTSEIINDINILIIQISGLLIALIPIFAFFRLGKVNDLMIGQGIAVYKGQIDILEEKKKSNEKQNKLILNRPKLNYKNLIKLRDAIDRKNIFGIEEALLSLTIDEIKKGNPGRTGYFKHIVPKYIKTKRHYRIIVLLSILAVMLFMITLLSIFINVYDCNAHILNIKWITSFFISAIIITFILIS